MHQRYHDDRDREAHGDGQIGIGEGFDLSLATGQQPQLLDRGLSAGQDEIACVQTSAEIVVIPLSGWLSRVMSTQVVYALRPEARNRLNTIFMGGMFVGGAIGSAGAVLVLHTAGWYAVCAFGAALVAIALAHAWSRL